MEYVKAQKAIIGDSEELIQTAKIEKGLVIEKFTVPTSFVGLVIGQKGANINKANSIPEVTKINVDKTRSESDGVCDVTV